MKRTLSTTGHPHGSEVAISFEGHWKQPWGWIMDDHKTLGLNGPPYKFYNDTLVFFISKLLNVYHEALIQWSLGEKINWGLIKFIIAEGGSKIITNWRPITLHNTNYKFLLNPTNYRYMLYHVIIVWEGMEGASCSPWHLVYKSWFWDKLRLNRVTLHFGNYSCSKIWPIIYQHIETLF